MAITALEVSWAGWVITVVGWLLSPIITLLLPKILSCLGFDSSAKLQELEIYTIPELQQTMQVVDQERMLDRAKKVQSDVAVLDKMAAMLRHAREDAEDIFDDAQDIESRRSRDILYDAVKACNRSCMWIECIVRTGLARLLQPAPAWSEEPILVNITAAASDEPVAVAINIAASDEQAFPVAANIGEAPDEPAQVAASSDSASHEPVPVTAPSYSSHTSIEVFKNRCRSILCWLVDVFEAACFCRNWSYEVVGITNNQENATIFDIIVTAIPRWNLKKRIEKIESIISEVKKSPLLGAASKTASQVIANKNRSRIRTTSNRKVFGREALRDSIMAKLRENPHGTSPCYSVIGIYGVAGSGKTTFARYIRDFIEDECKEENLFDTIMCIHASETFRVEDLFHEMLKDITKDRHSNILHCEELEEKLKECLRGKRFFLILDDLWVKTKNDAQLEELISPLIVGLKGSKILVTARTKVAAGALCADEPMKMPDLDEDQYLSMFMHYALGGTSFIHKEFERVGRVVTEKLHGSPIAAVIVAGRLGANRDINFWKNTAERDMLNDTMDALWWSYQQLSLDIRCCFEYCNIFPRRFEMKKEDLVHLWIAQGFVKSSCLREDMEDVAEGYIQELISCSFFQPDKTRWGEEFFRIHDLLHDLADMVTGNNCFRIENEGSHRGETWKGDIHGDVRHLFIQNYDAELITEETVRFRNLRTLIINVVGRDTQVEENVIDKICKKLPKLRVLRVASKTYGGVGKPKFFVAEAIGQLKHLRYLAFRTNMLCTITLPSTLNKLRHIQLLDFGEGHIGKFNFAKLFTLRHLFCWEVVELPYIGRLSSLQTLSGFKVSNEQGCELKQLRDLNKLRGKLTVSGLENVKSKGQALQANLATKRLTDLTLQWAFHNETRCGPEVEADVLEGLCPPLGLQILRLYNFVSWTDLDWMVDKHTGGPKYLQELYIMRCKHLVPASGLPEAFPHLRVLWLVYCSWDALPGNMEHLASLKILLIHSCENIRYLPTLPQTLKQFTLSFCNNELIESCQTVGHPNWQKIEHIPYKDID